MAHRGVVSVGMEKGFLLIISGPSGAGKGSISKRLARELEGVVLSISCTTRPPRPGEVHGADYFFLTEDEFIKRVQFGDFLECAKVYDKWMYGTPTGFVQENIDSGNVVILEIDVQGFREVMESSVDKVSVFISPSDRDELERRIKARAPMDKEELGKRIHVADEEYEYIPLFDYFVINDDLDKAVANVAGIIRAERSRVSRQHENIKTILQMKGMETDA
jgi:guanylate kinase